MEDVEVKFDNYDDLLACAEGPCEMGRESRASLTPERAGNWYGTPGLEAAVKLARFGWPEGLERIDAMTREVEDAVGQRVDNLQVCHWDVAGDAVDVGRFVEGDPECMMQFETVDQEGEGRIIDIRVNVAASCGFDAEVLYRRGAATVALVDVLERNGYSCNITSVQSVKPCRWGAPDFLTVETPLKEAGELLDKDRLAFALAHPSFLRRLIFSVEEHQDAAARSQFGISAGAGYGTPADRPEDLAMGDDSRGLYLKGMMRGGDPAFKDQAAAVDWVVAQANRLMRLEVAA